MSVQTPIFVSNNSVSTTQDRACSIVDANGTIYTSLRDVSSPYGGIQKTNTFGSTSIFLQLNSSYGSGNQFPSGMCFDSNGYLYYAVFGNNNIYRITDFNTPNPILVTLGSATGIQPSAPFRIVIDKNNSNIFYISSTNPTSGSYTIKSYNISTNAYITVFSLPNSSYGLVQDSSGLYLYIGVSAGQIYKGIISSGSTSVWLSLPDIGNVVGLIFTDNNTLFANTSIGNGYKITINPSTGVGTYELYYNTTTTTITGGLGVNSQATYLYGISSNQLWKIYGTQTILTGYNFLYNNVQTDFANVFKKSTPGTLTTGYKSAAYDDRDLGYIFQPGSSLVTTRYTSNLLSGNDLGSYFAPINAGAKIWSPLGAGTDDFVQSIAVNYITGNVYASGIFITAGGITVNNIAMWNGSSWFDLGGGCDAGVSIVTIDRITGNVYAGGYFTTAGGVPANYIAMWNGSSWSALGGGCGAAVETIAVVNSTNVYAGGGFTTAGGVSSNYIAKWNGSNWSTLGSGFNTTVNAIAVDSANNVYAGGYFTTAGALTVNRIAKWNGSSWSALGSGCNGDVQNIAIDSANNLYVSGYFITAGGVTVNRIAKWNGTNWFALGSGLTSSCWDIAIDSANNVYAGGYYTTAGGISANYIAKWNGTIWSTLIDATTGVNGCGSVLSAVAIDVVGNVYAGGGFIQAGGKSANNIAIYGPGEFTIIGTVTKTFDINYNTILTWTTSGSITFNTPFAVNYTIIGGGAGGNGGVTNGGSGGGAGGNGGGNGLTISSTWTSSISNTYIITLGSGGSPGTSGNDSSIIGVDINQVASRGFVSGGGAGGTTNTGSSSLIGGGGGGRGNITGGAAPYSGGTGGNGGGNGGNGGDTNSSLNNGNSGAPGAPGQDGLGGGGGGGGGNGYRTTSSGAGGRGGNGTVVLKFNVT